MAKGKIRKDNKTKRNPLVIDKPTLKDLTESKRMVFSFEHFDNAQSETFAKWEEDGKLAKAVDRLREYSKKTVSQTDGEYTIYGGFPPKSDFTHPSHVPEDANWARIHVDGLHVIAGHVVSRVFYVVFLDSNHRFWITEKKHA